MKKEVEVKINKTEKQTQYFCDLCEKEYDFKYTQSPCYVCHRDVCSDCSILKIVEIPDGTKYEIIEPDGGGTEYIHEILDRPARNWS